MDYPSCSSRGPEIPPSFASAIASIKKLLAICGTPGLCVGVIRDGHNLFTESFGLRDVDKDLPIDPDSIFVIGSVSKAFLSAAIGVAVEEGRMEFDDLLAKFLPDFDPVNDPSIRSGATLIDCLSHKSGLANPQILLCGPGNLPLQSEEHFVDFVNSFPTRTFDGLQRFRQRYNYTNSGYSLPALALQKVFNCRYATFLRDRVIQPLGLRRTVVTRSAMVGDRNVAFPYVRLSNASFAKIDLPHIPDENHTPILAAMGIRSSVNDLLKLCRLFLSSGHCDTSTPTKPNAHSYQTILNISHTQIPKIHSPQWTWDRDTPNASSYCLGWVRTDLPTSQIGKHTYNFAAQHPSLKNPSSPPIIGASSPSRPVFQCNGTMSGAACSISLFPSDQCAIVACANGNTDGDAADWATKLLIQALFGLEPEIDFVALAEEEALARRKDYDRILSDWTRMGPGSRDNVEAGDDGTLTRSEYEKKIRDRVGDNGSRPHFNPEDIDIPWISLSPFSDPCHIPSLDPYIGTYHALNTTITITGSSSRLVPVPTLAATFNDIPASRQQLTWYKTDCWSWFPLTRDKWLLRRMSDRDFWGTGVFEFVREEKGGEGKMSALLWQWDEQEAATRFERLS